MITFRFEGLFTFVVRRNSRNPAMPNGVFVLAPETKPPFPHPHVPTVVAGAYSGTFADDIDIRGANATLTAGPGPRIGHLLPLTRVDKVKIHENFLTGAYPSVANKLQARIILPLHKLVTFENDVKIQWEKAPNTWVDCGTVTGVTELSYDTTGPVNIPGVPMPFSGSEVIFKYLTAHNQLEDHPAHHKLLHAEGYAPIFDGKKPQFRTQQAYNASKIPAKGRGGVQGVDPVLCSQGGGCDPNDVACNNCDPTDPSCGEG
jgi:hypothetical protein